MPPILPESDFIASETERVPLWRHEYNRYALALALLFHLALLTSVVLSSSRQPAFPQLERPNTDVVFYLPNPPEKKIAKPAPAAIKVARPTVDLPPPKAP